MLPDTLPMRPHHARALAQAQARLLSLCPDVIAILLGGSIARGIDRDASDVDLIVVVPDAFYGQKQREFGVAFLWYDLPGFEGRLVEGRYVPKAFLVEAARRGSEPTRNSLFAARVVYCVDAEIPPLLPLIPVYQEGTHREHIAAFYSQMAVNRTFFWDQGKANRYLQLRAASDIVLFGCRLILAHNRILCPGQRRLVEFALAAPQKPERFEETMNAFLCDLSDETKEAFCQMIDAFADWDKDDRYLTDVEMGWFHHIGAVSEW